MRYYKILILLATTTSCDNSADVNVSERNYLQAPSEPESWIKPGSFYLTYHTSKKPTTQQKNILKKLAHRLSTNQHIRTYFDSVYRGATPVYNSKFGITRKEYNSLLELYEYKEPVYKQGKLTIMRNGELLTFKGEGDLRLFDSLTINTKTEGVIFKQYEMGLNSDSIDLSYEDIPQGETIENHQLFTGPTGPSGLLRSNGTYELLIGKLKPGGGVYLSFFAKLPYSIEHPIPEYRTLVIRY